MAGDSLVTWSFRNEATAKKALSALTTARRDLLQRLGNYEGSTKSKNKIIYDTQTIPIIYMHVVLLLYICNELDEVECN